MNCKAIEHGQLSVVSTSSGNSNSGILAQVVNDCGDDSVDGGKDNGGNDWRDDLLVEKMVEMMHYTSSIGFLESQWFLERFCEAFECEVEGCSSLL
ncbi:hypothetical protein KC19_2G271400 [Ceratodon purpureus]|uniref:Uncharacterized protein n=1 Tax=Ceratodon purpureus TaxID=3225 RepID=A0A8T0J001_CERPU|nr:hypothetical protein KC19_2G271400 [Ceratodon purpureus]